MRCRSSALSRERINGGDFLNRYANGKVTSLFTSGKDLPGEAKIPIDWVVPPVSMNQRGQIVFGAGTFFTLDPLLLGGTYLRDPQTGQISAIALNGMPAVAGRTYAVGGGWAPAINNNGEIVLVAEFQQRRDHTNLLFIGRDGKPVPVALSEGPLPGGDVLLDAWLPSLTDNGQIAFVGRRRIDRGESGYLWENGTTTPLLTVGDDTPGDGKVVKVHCVWLNSQNRSALIDAQVAENGQLHDNLYRWNGGQLTSVAAFNQPMPGGGKFRSMKFAWLGFGSPTGCSFGNATGQHAFLAQLDGDISAA